MSNQTSIDRPFDAELYEDEGDEDEILDEEGRARLKLKVVTLTVIISQYLACVGLSTG